MTDFAAHVGRVINRIGDAAVYHPAAGGSITTSVIVDRDIEAVGGFDSKVREHKAEITVRLDQVTNPKRGDTVTVGGVTWTVDAEIRNDGIVAVLAVR